MCFLSFLRLSCVIFPCACLACTHTRAAASNPLTPLLALVWRAAGCGSRRNGQSSEVAPPFLPSSSPRSLCVFSWCCVATPAQDHKPCTLVHPHPHTHTGRCWSRVGAGHGSTFKRRRAHTPNSFRPEGGKTPRGVMARPRAKHHPTPWATTCRLSPALPAHAHALPTPRLGVGAARGTWVLLLPRPPLAHHQLSLPFCPTHSTAHR